MNPSNLPGIPFFFHLEQQERQELPVGYEHVRGKQALPFCTKLKIKYSAAVVGRYPKRGRITDLVDGVIVAENDAARLRRAIDTSQDEDEFFQIADDKNTVDVTWRTPVGYSHIPRKRLQPLCRRLNVKFANAVIRRERRECWFDRARMCSCSDGILVCEEDLDVVWEEIRKRDEAKLNAAPKRLKESVACARFAWDRCLEKWNTWSLEIKLIPKKAPTLIIVKYRVGREGFAEFRFSNKDAAVCFSGWLRNESAEYADPAAYDTIDRWITGNRPSESFWDWQSRQSENEV